MIKLKTEVNKSAIMRDLHNEAVEIYKNAYEGEYAIEQFLYGAEKLFEKLRQYNVRGRSEQCCSPTDGFYLGTTCHHCNKPFRKDIN